MFAIALLVVSMIPAVFAVSIGTGVGIDIETEDFAPLVWQCGHRLVYDDATEPGRISDDGDFLVERMNNYAFEGEQIEWVVLVMDKNGVEKIEDVFATIGDTQGEGNDIEVNCQEKVVHQEEIFDSCNARILEEKLTLYDKDIMQYYMCTLTVETPDSMDSEYWVTVEAVDLDGLSGIMAENEYWFFNPVIALSIDGDLVFEEVRPGTMSYSETLLIGNDAEESSGVRLDMFISGTDFYDSSSSGAMCPTTNQLVLGDGDSDCDRNDPFCYHATHGAYSTNFDPRNDDEGYVGIDYGIGFNDPNPFYDGYEIMQSGPMNGPYYQSNILSPGAEMAITFRLNLPEPCNGDFDTGAIYFWGEAI